MNSLCALENQRRNEKYQKWVEEYYDQLMQMYQLVPADLKPNVSQELFFRYVYKNTSHIVNTSSA